MAERPAPELALGERGLLSETPVVRLTGTVLPEDVTPVSGETIQLVSAQTVSGPTGDLTTDTVIFRNTTSETLAGNIGGQEVFLLPGDSITYGQLAGSFPSLGLPLPANNGVVAGLSLAEFENETVGFFNNLFNPQAAETDLTTQFGDLLSSLGGGGGFGGVGRTYVKPDERLLDDAIKARLVALVGGSSPARIAMLSDLYMKEDRRNFDTKGEQIDPMASVQAKIEGFSDYQQIHALRPETEDQFQWVSSRVGALARAGVTSTRAQEIAIEQAKVAGTEADVARAGELATFQATGRALPGFMRNMQTSARAALSLL